MAKTIVSGLLGKMYATNFFYGLHFALIVYVLSSYISGFVGETYVGLGYTCIALISIFFSLNFVHLINWLGHRALTLVLIALTILSSVALAFVTNPTLAIILVVIYSVVEFLLLIAFDLALEELSSDAVTGDIRGVYLTLYNLAFVAGPLITTSVIGENNYGAAFSLGAVVLFPSLLLFLFGLRKLPAINPKGGHMQDGIKVLSKNRDLRKIFISTFVLEFFYTWMTIYTPLYLHDHIGMPWGSIGVIFTIMLFPFVLFQLPLGILADRYWGEQEILTAGFIVSAIATAGLFFIGSGSIFVWAAILFLTRVGASAIEIMNETYFFKKVSVSDTGVIALVRNARQFNYILAPIIAIIFLLALPMKGLFLILGAVMLVGAFNASTLRDTKPSRS